MPSSESNIQILRDLIKNPWTWSKFGPRVIGEAEDALNDIEEALRTAEEREVRLREALAEMQAEIRDELNQPLELRRGGHLGRALEIGNAADGGER